MVKKQGGLVAISWASSCSRSDSLAERLGGRSYMVYSPIWGSRYSTILFKYAVQALKTLWVLLGSKPDVVLVMAPPVVACLPVWIYARVFGARYAIDAHTAAFVDSRWRSVIFLQRFFSRRAVTTIVTNQHFADVLRSWNAHVTIVSDVPICFPEPVPVAHQENSSLTLVSSFTNDEPLEIFIEAARKLPDIQFYVTGDFRSADSRILQAKPDNLKFTGYLPGPEYVGLLLGSAAVISLTTLDHTMQRGAYEAVFLGKPVITSNFELLRQIFHKGAVHVDGTSDDIVRGIVQMTQDLERYRHEATELRSERLNQWLEVKQQLQSLFFRTSGTKLDTHCA